MAVRGIYDTPEEAPEALREYLVQKDNRWLLDVEGFVTKDTLDEFRTTNRGLTREREKLQKDLELMTAQLTDVQTKYKDVDPEEYRSLKSAPGDIQKQITEAETRLKAQFQQELQSERESRQQAEQRLDVERIKTAVAQVSPKMGIVPTALSNIQRDAVEVFKLVDGLPVPHDKTGPRYSDKAPSKYMDVEEWLGTLADVHPEYFAPSSGGGAGGGLGGGRTNGHRVIPASDQRAMLQNIEAIAKGTVDVDMNA